LSARTTASHRQQKCEVSRLQCPTPNARFVEITEAGHMSTLENPAVVNQVIREFLQSLPT
jgi:pimeloyl-ACP methyl ester carboxylesterase